MYSHKVPQRLLKEFSYLDPLTNSRRLWRYQKGYAPAPRISPKSATSIDGHLSHPEDPKKEAELEARLNDEVENPVNRFLFSLTDAANLTSANIRHLSFYVALLFLRSEARQKGSAHSQEIRQLAVRKFLENDQQIETVAAHWTMELFHKGKLANGRVTRQHVIRTALAVEKDNDPVKASRLSYLTIIERFLCEVDQGLLTGKWGVLRTPAAIPFVISDAPVVTWDRRENGRLYYGVGFSEPNVEVLLPISPLACLYILPNVKRTRSIIQPSVEDINAAQAAFANRYCFANANIPTLDQILQPAFGRAVIGRTCFTLWHKNYDNMVFDLLMNNGKFVPPPSR
jgi:hypothetical protein